MRIITRTPRLTPGAELIPSRATHNRVHILEDGELTCILIETQATRV